MRLWCVVLAACCAVPTIAAEYADPDGAFAFVLPDGWAASRQPVPDLGLLTEAGPTGGAAAVTIVTVTTDRPIEPERLPGIAEQLIGMIHNIVAEQGQILSQQTSQTTLVGATGIRSDLSYRDGGDQSVWEGWATVVLSGPRAILFFVNWPQAQPAVKQLAEGLIQSVALASRSPRTAGDGAAAPTGLFSAARLQATAQRMGSRMRPPDNQILVEGAPPLTVGSVTAFCGLLSKVFGVELGEAEYEQTKERFIEYFNQADDQGRMILAGTAQNILRQLGQGTPQEQAQNIQEVRGVFEQRLQAGAAQNITWAKVLWDAIQRRQQTVCRTAATPPPQPGTEQYDQEVSEADLDAAVEMLYFMWVTSGRDASLVTPQLVAQVRAALAQKYTLLAPQLQLLVANAEKVYSQIRGAWLQADPAQQQVLAQQFSQTLDAFGLPNPAAQGGGGGGGGGAWGDVDPSTMRAELVANTCYNLSQRATGGAWPSSPRD